MTRSDAMEVLKEPHKSCTRILRDALKTFYKRRFLVKDFEVGGLDIMTDTDKYIHINTDKYFISKYSNYILVLCDIKITIPVLDKYFKHPLLPTEEERTLFEMEVGFEYPLKTDNAPLKMDKAPLKMCSSPLSVDKAQQIPTALEEVL